MADMSFDVVYAGGGYGALMSAPYFCMNGMSVGIFEAAPELGGGHASDSRPLPGFTGNPHAHAIVATMAPQVQDFKVWEKGAFLRVPEEIMDVVWPDGTAIKVRVANKWDMYTGESTFDEAIYEANYESIARISKHDADACRDLVQKMLQSWIYACMMDWMNPPPPYGELEWLEKLYTDPVNPIDPRYQHLTPAEIAKEFFVDRRFTTWYVRQCCSIGFWPDKLISPVLFLLQSAAMFGLAQSGYWEGGTHQIVHALQRVLADYSAKTYVNHEVDKILVENGRARGIRLVDGTEIEAKKLVCTNVDPRQLTFRFLRDFPISELIKTKVRNISADSATLFWGNVAYHEPPQYIAEEFCPGIGRASAVYMGDDDLEYFLNDYHNVHKNIRPGQWPEKMYFFEDRMTVNDPRMAPPGKHNSLIEEFGPPASALSEREWQQVRREIGPRMIKEWQKYAPNMTEDNIIGIEIDTPGDFERRDPTCVEGSWQMGVAPTVAQWGRYRPIAEYSRYKVPGIENLYCTGIGWHSNFGSPGGFAYNMYKQAAWDHGLREFWKEKGREW